MTIQTKHKDDYAADRCEIFKRLGLKYTATFQPKPQAGEKSPKLHWLITLSRGNVKLEVPYSQGIAHVVGYKRRLGPQTLHTQEEYNLFVKTCETGKLYRKGASAGVDWHNGEQPAPTLEEVMYCLVSDASVLDYSTYEEWGPELGYNADSREGERIYRECIKQSLGLRRLIGDKAMTELREAYQGY